MNVLQKVHHPHTVQFFGAVTKQTPYMIVTEFMSCGSMSDMFRCVGVAVVLAVGFLIMKMSRCSNCPERLS
jgi:serine/threonine protein kinase